MRTASNHNLCDSSAVLQQLNDQANWELVMWLDDKPVGDGYISIYNNVNTSNSCI